MAKHFNVYCTYNIKFKLSLRDPHSKFHFSMCSSLFSTLFVISNIVAANPFSINPLHVKYSNNKPIFHQPSPCEIHTVEKNLFSINPLHVKYSSKTPIFHQPTPCGALGPSEWTHFPWIKLFFVALVTIKKKSNRAWGPPGWRAISVPARFWTYYA